MNVTDNFLKRLGLMAAMLQAQPEPDHNHRQAPTDPVTANHRDKRKKRAKMAEASRRRNRH